MTKRNLLLLVALLLLTATVLAGCGTSDKSNSGDVGSANPPKQTETPSNSESKDSTKTEQQEAPEESVDGISEPTTLYFYNISRDSEETFMDQMGNAIMEKFPNLTIKYVERVAGESDLAQYIPSGEPIDLIWGSLGSWPGGVPAYGLEYDMTDLVKKHNVDLSRFEPTLIDAMVDMSEGELWGLPLENSVNVIIYNKDIFDNFGVEYPTDGMTWDEFFNLSLKLDRIEDGIAYTGYAPAQNYVILSNQYSLPQIDPETRKSTFDTNEKWVKTLNTEMFQFAMLPGYQRIAEEYRKGTPLKTQQFLDDKVAAMTMAGPLWPIVLAEQLEAFDWDFVSFPHYEDLPNIGQQAYPMYMSIANMSEHKDAAMQVIKFLTSDEFQTVLSKKGHMTVLDSEEIQKLVGQDTTFSDKNLGAYYYNDFAPIPKDLRNLASQTNSLNAVDWGAVMGGEKDINTALREAAEKVNAAIAATGQ